MIVVMPDREWHWYVASTTPPVPADRTGYVGAEVAREADAEAPPRRPIGFRMPEAPAPKLGLALPDWLLP